MSSQADAARSEQVVSEFIVRAATVIVEARAGLPHSADDSKANAWVRRPPPPPRRERVCS